MVCHDDEVDISAQKKKGEGADVTLSSTKCSRSDWEGI